MRRVELDAMELGDAVFALVYRGSRFGIIGEGYHMRR
jgi:hypothetical protein